jgi:hypothetical protein
MTARPPEAERRPTDWRSPTALRLHAALIAGLALSAAGTWIEWRRAFDGRAVAWVYAFEWPLLAAMGTYLWWQLLHGRDTLAGRVRARPARPRRRAPIDPDDPELIAWQRYPQQLHAVDPPGGPPSP